MSYLVAALVIIGAVAILDLLLTVAVIRRLRHVAAAVAQPQQRPFSTRDVGPAMLVGRPVPSFAAVSVDGDPLDGSDFIGRGGVIGFFSTGCSACHEQAPEFARLAAAEPTGRASVIAVVSGGSTRGESVAALVTALRETTTVVIEPAFEGTITNAFAVNAFPTLVRVDSTATVVAAGVEASDLRSGAPVT